MTHESASSGVVTDDAAVAGPAADVDTWNGIPIPPRPPLPVREPHTDTREVSAQVGAPAVQPGFIGLPPGLITTVPANSGAVPVTAFEAPNPPRELPSVLLPNGEMYELNVPVLIGRDPQASVGFENAELLPVNDIERSVSKTHAAVVFENGEVLVIDLHSTNGTFVIDETGLESVCQPSVATPVADGAGIRFGRYRVGILRG